MTNGEAVAESDFVIPNSQFVIVSKAKIAANGDYNLSGERYRENGAALTVFPFRLIKDLAIDLRAGFASGQSGVDTVGVPHVRPMNINEDGRFVAEGMKSISEDEYKGREEYALEPGDVLFNNTNSVELVGKTCLIEAPIRGGFSNHMTRIRVNRDICIPRFLSLVLHDAWRRGQFTERATRWVGQAGINTKSLGDFEVPLPPLEVQKQIVAEIEGYQKVIDGACAVLDNYRPHIPIHPDWPMVVLGDATLFRVESGGTPKSEIAEYWGGPIAWATLVDLPASDWVSEIRGTERTITDRGLSESSAKLLPVNSVIVSTRATIGRIGISRIPLATNQGFKNVVVEDGTRAVPEYVAYALTNVVPTMEAWATGGTFKELSKSKFCELRIPLPPLETQRAIVAEIEAEQALVAANRELVARMEKKIQAVLARVWGG